MGAVSSGVHGQMSEEDRYGVDRVLEERRNSPLCPCRPPPRAARHLPRRHLPLLSRAQTTGRSQEGRPAGGGHARQDPRIRVKGEVGPPRPCASSRDADAYATELIKMAVVLCSCSCSCSSLSAAGGLDGIGFYLLCSLFENLRCSRPNLRPQEEESKFLKFMRNPLSICQHRGKAPGHTYISTFEHFFNQSCWMHTQLQFRIENKLYFVIYSAWSQVCTCVMCGHCRCLLPSSLPPLSISLFTCTLFWF